MSHQHSEHTHAHTAPGPVPAPPASAPPGQALSISPRAAAKLAELLAAEKKDPAIVGLRLGVQGGGCSGLTYIMEFDQKRETDRVFSLHGVQVFVDPKSILYMSGSVLDYAEGLMGSGFSIKNPNVKGSCGCGHSFTT
jgi:iron-sulfur cluster assembly protein